MGISNQGSELSGLIDALADLEVAPDPIRSRRPDLRMLALVTLPGAVPGFIDGESLLVFVAQVVLALIAEPHRMRSRGWAPFWASLPEPAQSGSNPHRCGTDVVVVHHGTELVLGTFINPSPRNMLLLGPKQAWRRRGLLRNQPNGPIECRQVIWPHCLHEFWPQHLAR
jgi:hypothetical protein